MRKGDAVRGLKITTFTGFLLAFAGALLAGPLEDYVAKADTNYSWRLVTNREVAGISASQLKLTSQHWRESNWTHSIEVVRPEKMRHPEIGFLFITGDGDGRGSVEMLKILADRAGAVAAIVTKVPKQPLYGGQKEDALFD